MTLSLDITTKTWPMHEPFAISRGTQREAMGLVVTLVDADGRQGHGESCSVDYLGETMATMRAQIERVRTDIEAGPRRERLLQLLPQGGARCALDSALWDIEAKRSGRSPFAVAGITKPVAVDTAFTIGIRAPADYVEAARARAEHALLKLKVDARDPVAAVRAARSGAPSSRFIVDPNQSWSIAQLKVFAPALADLGVVLLEQPIAVGMEAGLDDYRCPVHLCADELIANAADLALARGRFDVINIKLEKSGGLTAALDLADAAQSEGFGLMVGCMAGSSLAMAPGTVLAQRAEFVDLDGPLLQSSDWPDALVYEGGRVAPPCAALWG
jgi:L-alanine-DL-glutamate epimerase-like enolase superfamily enzyme